MLSVAELRDNLRTIENYTWQTYQTHEAIATSLEHNRNNLNTTGNQISARRDQKHQELVNDIAATAQTKQLLSLLI